MAAYVRQSTFSDGDTIFASLLNNEFDQLLAAFNVSTGHTHDGSTTGDGGPISKLFSNAITFGKNEISLFCSRIKWFNWSNMVQTQIFRKCDNGIKFTQ